MLPSRCAAVAAALVVALAGGGCAIFHPYPFDAPAGKAERRACRQHCGGIAGDLHAGTCWLACASAQDPWYLENGFR